MRNLKRALSLALASVMLLGMMVVGSSAKGLDDFSDNAEIVNKDAVAVTSAIGLFDGYEDGSFGPENVVTRAEMAVIICTMLYGAGVNVNQFAETNVFTDVPAWAQGYVNLCSSLGIVAGVGDGKFDPNATVTTAQAVLMLCRALGYFQNAADFGDNWMLAATAKGTALGLYGDLKLTANEGLTRDNVAELVFNALTKAVPVQYNELLGVYYNENQGIIYSLEFNYLQTLGYKNFDLVYKTDTETIYGRPATTWGTGSYNVKTDAGDTSKTDTLTEDGGLIASMVRMLDKDEIITVPNTPTYTYTTGTDEDDVYKDLGKSVCDETDYDWTVYVNGEKVYDEGTDVADTVYDNSVGNDVPERGEDADYQYTGKGTVTEHKMFAKNDPGSGWGCNEGRIKPMPITISNCQTKDGKIVIYASEAKFTDDPIEDGYFGCGGVAEIPHLQDKCITLAKGGFKHHTAICEGHYKDILKEAFTTYLGYEWVDIDR